MSYWNYRLVRNESGQLTLAEVYYDDHDRPWGYTEDVLGPMPDEDLDEDRDMLLDAFSRPILNHDEITGEGPVAGDPEDWISLDEWLDTPDEPNQKLIGTATPLDLDEYLAGFRNARDEVER